jgi:uncharacterized protein (DUF952 family)
MIDWVYKIVRRAEWDEAEKTGIFTGSADDRRDGFIHLSSANQVRTTYDKYFQSEGNLLLAAMESVRLGAALKWDVSRGGEKFPHLYAALPLVSVHSVLAIGRTSGGRPIFSPEIP